MNNLIEKYNCLTKNSVTNKTVREVVDYATDNKEKLSKLFPSGRNDDKNNDAMREELVEFHEPVKDFIDYLYEQQQVIKKAIAHLFPTANQINNLISESRTSVTGLLWSLGKIKFSVPYGIVSYFFGSRKR